MKVVFVVGFFEVVYPQLEEKYPNQIAARTLVCVRQTRGKRHPDLAVLTSKLFDPPLGTTSVLVLLATLSGYEWVGSSVATMITNARQRFDKINFEVQHEVQAASAEKVESIVSGCGLAEPSPITMQLLEKMLGDTRVVCVSAESRPSFREVMRRSGFPEEAWLRFFSEVRIPNGKNSNLVSVISAEANHSAHLLYAWDTLRTLDAATKRRFSGKSYEAPTAAKVLNTFREWLLQNRSE